MRPNKFFFFLLLPLLLFLAELLLQGELLAKPLQVTLLLEHKGESPWHKLLKAGLSQAAQDFPLQIKVVVEEDEARKEAVFRAEASQADLVIIATDGFHEILRDNARSFPKVRFGVIDASIRSANTYCITFADEQAAFLAGACASLVAKAQSKGEECAIGWLSGADQPALRSMFNGFREGAKLEVPEIRVLHGVVGSFTNPKAAAKESRRLIKEGVKVLVLASGLSNAGALKEAREHGLYVIGLDSDAKDILKGNVLLSILKDVSGAVYTIIKDTVQGNFKAKEIVVYDLKHGVSITDPRTSLGHELVGLNKIERRLKELWHELTSGGIKVRSLRQKTLCNCL